ncbi:hypothetical protein SAMN05444412_103229 [Rhodonellum ikkaensis]|uniref:Uncharacterized protein n=1 Tax=Rhodonellum ikkaensis TaxID=336829 RepID=A0A1H3NF10_9BACT|nr:hypothetical protein SAMN05444412_103229 [Rhodonellum ikkaensis]
MLTIDGQHIFILLLPLNPTPLNKQGKVYLKRMH